MPETPESRAAYVLDTSAILAYLLNEPAAARVKSLHRQAAIPFIAISELYAALWIRYGQAKADAAAVAVREWQLPTLWPSEEVVLLAGRWRATYRLGLGDSYIAALTFMSQSILVTKDADFLPLQSSLRLLFL